MLTIMGIYAGRHGIDGRLIARYPIDSASAQVRLGVVRVVF